MKNLLLLFLFLILIPYYSYSQDDYDYNIWYNSRVVDKFGDSIATTKVIFVKGTFDNSATRGSDFIIKMALYDGDIILECYQYSSTPVEFYSKYNTVYLKYKTLQTKNGVTKEKIEDIKMKVNKNQLLDNSGKLQKMLKYGPLKVHCQVTEDFEFTIELPKLPE